MLKNITLAFGVVFVLVGLLGFVPAAVIDGKLLGIFGVNTLHNIIHIASGLAALYAALSGGPKVMKMYGQVFGVVYALVTVVGFLGILDALLNVNPADNILHIVLTAGLLYIGFGMDSATETV
jgi:hypothetical protein